MAGNGSHDSIDELIFLNELQQIGKSKGSLADIVGTIGPTPNKFGGLSEDELLDMVMSVTPMGASIRGGKVAKPILDQLLGLSSKLGIKQGVSNLSKHLPKKVQDYLFQNKLNAARLQKQKVLDKLDIEDPDKIFRGFSEN